MLSMLCENIAIHAVPSACSRYSPFGSGALLSKIPMLSNPRNPPSNTFLPPRSFLFTHHVKFSSSLRKQLLRNSRSPCLRMLFSVRYTYSTDHACTGGFTSPKFHSYAG